MWRSALVLNNKSTIYALGESQLMLLPHLPELQFSFGVDRKSHEQSPYTWAIKAHDPTTSKDKKKIPTYVSFVFRYRGEGELFLFSV